MNAEDIYVLAVNALRSGAILAADGSYAGRNGSMDDPGPVDRRPVQRILWGDDALGRSARVSAGRPRRNPTDDDDERVDLAHELVTVADALGYRPAVILTALGRLKARMNERTACSLLMDRMLAKKPIYGIKPAQL